MTTLNSPARWALILALAALPATGAEAARRDLSYADLMALLTDLDLLPAVEPGVSSGQFSSYDRSSRYDPETDTYVNWDANADWGQYIRIDEATGEGVMAEMEGPGAIVRIWSANPQGVIRFYLDGDTEPTYEFDFHELFTGRIEPFVPPFTWMRYPDRHETASNLYLPIPYAKSCRVTTVIPDAEGPARTPQHYYIINYRSFPEDWTVESFRLPFPDAWREAVDHAARRWNNPGQVPAHPLDRFATGRPTLGPGERVVVADLEGPAVIRQLRMKLDADEEWATRKVMLRVYWDGDDTPAVNAPIGDFFGDPKDSNYRSYPMGITEESNYCFFPMPFRGSARVELTNDGRRPVVVDSVIIYRTEEIPDHWGHFHAKWRTEISSATFDYPMIETYGTGKLVGITLFPHNHHGGWWGEGDEKVYIDGEKFPSWFGTGTEDYFGDAWGIRTMHQPSYGFPQPVDGSEARDLFACYRWHLADNIPYARSLRMTMENYTGQEHVEVRNDYASVAYWYQLPGGRDFFEDPPVWSRIPRTAGIPHAIEPADALTEADLAPGMSVVDGEGLPHALSTNRGVRLIGRVGDAFTLKLPIPRTEYYEVDTFTARDVPASSFQATLRGEPFEGVVRLDEGVNKVRIRFTGDPVEGDRCEVIIDCFTARVHRRFIRDWLVMGPFPNPDGQGFDAVYPPERELKRDAVYEGRGGASVRWEPLHDNDGMILLNRLFDPKEHCVVYGWVTVTAPEAGRHTLLVGSDDGVKIWINGELVWEHFIRRMITADSDAVDVDLRQGENTLLIKLEQAEGDLGWGVRFRDPDERLIFTLPE